MGSSRAAAGGVLQVLRDFQTQGVAATLTRLNLSGLAGRGTDEILEGIVDVVCRDGGAIDEGVARDAWLETVLDVDEIGIVDLNTIDTAQITDTFQRFIAHSIEKMILQEIGARGFKVAGDTASIDAFQAQLSSYILGAVRDSFASDLNTLSGMNGAQIKEVVDQTYRDAWSILEAQGAAEE